MLVGWVLQVGKVDLLLWAFVSDVIWRFFGLWV